VEPVTSPTDQLSQTVVVHMGNMEAVTITAESGVFASAGPAVEVALLRNTVHHLEVVAKVRLIEWGGCKYGGYTLRTSRDKNGARLVIEQGQPAPPPQPNSVIGPDNVSQLQPLFALAPDARLTTDFAFESHDTLVSVGYDDEIVLWSLVTGQESGRLGDGKEEAEATCLALTSDRSRMATCGTYPDWGIRLWSMATGGMSEFDDPEAEAGALAFSPSGSLLASGSNDNVVWIWDVASREAIASFAGDVPQRNQMFHGFYWLSEQVLVAAGSDAIYWWDVSTGEQLERLVRPEQALFFVDSSFTQEGDRLAAAAQDDNVYVWSPDAGTWSVWPAAAGLQLSHVAFSPDGRLLAAVSFSGHLLLWNAETEELAASWNSNGGGATVRFSHDGRYIAAGGWDSPVWLWGIPLLGNTEMMVDDPDGKRTSHRSKHRR
jgi:WD40 repeat protein